MSQFVDNRLEERLHVEDIEWTGEELLHAIREVDPEKVPDWRNVYDPEEDAEWSTIQGLTPCVYRALALLCRRLVGLISVQQIPRNPEQLLWVPDPRITE
ncbi:MULTISPECIES: hypothetical protein [Haloarcula]|nr:MULTISPECIES: hypothetical protein [Haloarcula]GGK79904.1 hypothetical protein GCM10009067_35280 [Haloarcula sebkhae]